MPREKMDVRGEPVEGFKLTKGQMQFQRGMGALNKMKAMLQLRTLAAQSEMKNVTELWQLLEKGYSGLKPPTESTKELPGMNFAPEEGQGEQGEQGQAPAQGEGQQPPWGLNY